MLSLGATIFFGFSMRRKLKEIVQKLDMMDQKLDRIGSQVNWLVQTVDEINSKLDRLTWTVECGIIITLERLAILTEALERVALHQEAELWGKVRSAGKLAWQAQELEPSSGQRIQRLEHALALATEASERLLLLAQTEVTNAVDFLDQDGFFTRDFSVHSSLMCYHL